MTTTARRETLKQYTARNVRAISTEYSVPMTEVRQLYPDTWWADAWWGEILNAARSGEVIDARTLDALTPHQRYRIAHDYWRAIPDGYVNPEARHGGPARRLFPR